MFRRITLVAWGGIAVMVVMWSIAPNMAELRMVLEVPDESAVSRMLSMFKDEGLHFSVYED